MISGSIASREDSRPTDSDSPLRREHAALERAAKQWVNDNTPYQYYFRDVEYRVDDGVLTLRGRVPSFYLKQILQAVLGKLAQFERIDNRVEVIERARSRPSGF